MTNYNVLFEELIKLISEKVSDNILEAINPSKTSDEDPLLTIDEVSKNYNLSKATIYGLTHKKEIPFYKPGKRLFFLKSEILDWIKSGKQTTKSDLEIRANEYLSKNRLF
jgi:excisionase family DNA binding protein